MPVPNITLLKYTDYLLCVLYVYGIYMCVCVCVCVCMWGVCLCVREIVCVCVDVYAFACVYVSGRELIYIKHIVPINLNTCL